ncbi:MAG: alpha-hydroxy acid oxidase, partial [Gammaproteobacteria bacterium]
MTITKQELTSATASEPLAPAFGQTAARSRPGPRVLRHMLALDDFVTAAQGTIPRPIYGYITGGAETNASRRANREVWDEIAFVPRTLVDTSARTQKTTLFGRTYDAPFGIAPMGGTAMAAYQGDLVLARGAAAANVPMILSGASLTTLERVRQEGPTAWFQAYLPGEDGPITELVERVARAQYDTLVLTVDVQVAANRENNVRSGFDTPLRPTPRLAWDSITRPRWLIGMFLRTLLLHGMPHFENMGRRVPLISRTGERERGRRDRLSWRHLELMRRL